MLIKRIGAAILLGIGMELGTCLTKEVVQITKDPYKRATVKQKFNKIKDVILKKEES
jgi:hypothetical protein